MRWAGEEEAQGVGELLVSGMAGAGAENAVNVANAVGETALHLAVAGGHAAVVPLLLSAEARPHVPDRSGWAAAGLCAAGAMRAVAGLLQPERAGLPDGSPDAELDSALERG